MRLKRNPWVFFWIWRQTIKRILIVSCFIICIAVVDLNQEEIISIDVDCWCYFCYYYQHLLLKRALFSPFLKHNEKQSKRLFKGHLWYKLFHTDRQTDRQTQSAQLNELVAVEKNQSGDDNEKRQVSFERHHWQPARRSPFHSLTHSLISCYSICQAENWLLLLLLLL